MTVSSMLLAFISPSGVPDEKESPAKSSLWCRKPRRIPAYRYTIPPIYLAVGGCSRGTEKSRRGVGIPRAQRVQGCESCQEWDLRLRRWDLSQKNSTQLDRGRRACFNSKHVINDSCVLELWSRGEVNRRVSAQAAEADSTPEANSFLVNNYLFI